MKVGRFIERTIQQQFPSTSVYFLELATTPLPLWDESFRTGSPEWTAVWGPVSAQLLASDGFVMISPEWGGMVPAALKNLFLLAGTAELGHKPGLIVGVSASRGGAYPIAELRSSSYKNNHICYIPEHLIVREVKSVLNDPAPSSPEDVYIRNRIAYAVRVLDAYAHALIAVRAGNVLDHQTYPYGM